MAQITAIQHRRDTAANWTGTNPIPSAAELCIETDALTTAPKYKIGDGTTAYNALPYATAGADTTIYSTDGTLAGARTVTQGGNDLTITSTGGNTVFAAATGNITTPGDVAVNGGDLTTTATTASLFNTNATTLNIGGASTATSIGAGTGTTTFNNDVVISGALTIEGAPITKLGEEVIIEDLNIVLGSVATPTDTTANGGGITLKGATDKTIIWDNATDFWQFNQGIRLTTDGATYTAGAGTVAATDSIQQAVQKLDGNVALMQPLATITGAGAIYVGTGAGATTELALGAANTYLSVNAAGTALEYTAIVDGGSA